MVRRQGPELLPSGKLLAFTDLFIMKPKIIPVAHLFRSRYFWFCFGNICVIISVAGQMCTWGSPMKDLIENVALITVITVYREVLRFLSSLDLGLGGRVRKGGPKTIISSSFFQ